LLVPKQIQAKMSKYPEEYVDPKYWHPKCKNFELIDWQKWLATNPTVPKVYNPPQSEKLSGRTSIPMWWWARSCYVQPISCCLHSCCAVKPEMERISDGDALFRGLLNPENTSDDAPDVLGNHLLWTQDNIAAETLINFGSMAWRKQSDEGRVIGLGTALNDWTNDVTCFGYGTSIYMNTRFFVVQRSPDEKWYALSGFSSPEPETECSFMFIYVVQEGDQYETPDGNIIEYVKPGDLVRVSWDNTNPYETDNSKLSYMYFPRRVASINSEGLLVKNSPHIEDLLKVATSDASDKCCETCCYTCSCCMSPVDRFVFQTSHISDRQVFRKAPKPPTSEVIDRSLETSAKIYF